MILARVEVVLVRPTRPANVAAACRAMKNMGLRAPARWSMPADRLDRRRRGRSPTAPGTCWTAPRAAALREAVADCTLVAGTSGRPHGPTPGRRAELAEQAPARAGGGRIAVVFGPEAGGLRNDELALCHVRVHIPTDPAHPSLNLAQAVLLVAYEIRLAALGGPAARPRACPSRRLPARWRRRWTTCAPRCSPSAT